MYACTMQELCYRRILEQSYRSSRYKGTTVHKRQCESERSPKLFSCTASPTRNGSDSTLSLWVRTGRKECVSELEVTS